MRSTSSSNRRSRSRNGPAPRLDCAVERMTGKGAGLIAAWRGEVDDAAAASMYDGPIVIRHSRDPLRYVVFEDSVGQPVDQDESSSRFWARPLANRQQGIRMEGGISSIGRKRSRHLGWPSYSHLDAVKSGTATERGAIGRTSRGPAGQGSAPHRPRIGIVVASVEHGALSAAKGHDQGAPEDQ